MRLLCFIKEEVGWEGSTAAQLNNRIMIFERCMIPMKSYCIDLVTSDTNIHTWFPQRWKKLTN